MIPHLLAEVDICSLPALDGYVDKVKGHFACLALFINWFHNRKTGQCEQFIFGGCGGNENRFDTKEKCEERCGKK